MSYEKFGREIGEFLRGLLGVNSSTENLVYDRVSNPTDGYGASGKVYRNITASGFGLEANQAASLKPGNLLVVFHNQCFQVDPGSSEITYLFEISRSSGCFLWTATADIDGSIYCTASGSVSEPQPIKYATFGDRGAVLRVKHNDLEMHTIADLVDPQGIQFLDDSHMLVADFNNWGTNGQIYIVNRKTKHVELVVEGGLLTESLSVLKDEDGTIWVANGDNLRYDGEIICISPTGEQKVVRPKQGYGSGTVCSVFPSNASDTILGIIVDWPYMAVSSLFQLNKKSGKIENLLSASSRHRKVFSPFCAVDNNTVWLGEAYENELIAYDLNAREVVKKIDITAITGPYKGIKHAWDFVECVSIVPRNLSV